MSAWSNLFGEMLLSKDGEVLASEAFVEKKAVAIYFAASRVSYCQVFTGKLSEWYGNDLANRGLEIVYASSDESAQGFKDHFGQMPWLSIPYGNKKTQNDLAVKFRVSQVPTVVILNSEGKLITRNGIQSICQDPTGSNFPWWPKPLREMLGGSFCGSGEEKIDAKALEGKILGLYFGAKWSPPCRALTEQLAVWYRNLRDKKLDFEIVFVSADSDEDSWKDFFGSMPWISMPFEPRAVREQLSIETNVQSLPLLVFVDTDSSIITAKGLDMVGTDPQGERFPWYPPVVASLADSADLLHSGICMLGFCESCSSPKKAEVEDTLTSVAKPYMAKSKAEDVQAMTFLLAREAGGTANLLRTMIGLPLAVVKHQHHLENLGMGQMAWCCDGCGVGGPGVVRWNCAEGCDFDYCEFCRDAAGSSVSLEPRILIVDVAKRCYASGPTEEVSLEATQRLLDDFEGQRLEWQPFKQHGQVAPEMQPLEWQLS